MSKETESATATMTTLEKTPAKSPLAQQQPKSPLADLAGAIIRTPDELAARVRAVQGLCHLLSPMAAVSSIAPGYVVNVSVIPIDTSVDLETGLGVDVYFSPAIHKHRKGPNGEKIPLEVSLNKVALRKINAGVGINCHPLNRRDDGKNPNYWMIEANGDVTDFDGRNRRLPPGLVEVDLRDGSAQINGWTPEKWAENVKAAQAKAANAPSSEKWKFRPDPINGFTEERVLQMRRFGIRLAASKAMNALVREIGIPQKFSVEDLRKPFLALRAQWQPDMTDPEVRRMVTASRLDASHLLYPAARANAPEAPGPEDSAVTHGAGDPGQVIEGTAVVHTEPPVDKAPDDAVEVDLSAPEHKPNVYTVTRSSQRGDGTSAQYFFETAEGPTLFTADLDVARALDAARKAKRPVAAETERISIAGKSYLSVIETGGQQDLKL